jgi:cytidylate kinase
MAVITISREFGSGGDKVASHVAQALGYHFVDKEFIGDLLSQYGLVEFDREYDHLPGFWEKFNAFKEQRRDQIVKMLNQVIEAVARHGDVVIMGRSGFVVLAGYADVLHVRLQAPIHARIERIMALHKFTYERAEALVKDRDRVRVAFVEEFYQVPWEAMLAFDLVINTAKVTSTHATTWITEAAKALAGRSEPEARLTGSIQVDPVLAGAVSDQLKCKLVHG